MKARTGLLVLLAALWSLCQRPSKAAQVWPSKIAHLAEVTSL